MINIGFKRPLGEVHVGLVGNGIHGVFAAAADEFTGVAMAIRGEGKVSKRSRRERGVGRKRRPFQAGKESEKKGRAKLEGTKQNQRT